MSKYYQQTDLENNAYAVLHNLFLRLQIPFTNSYLSSELKNHPAYPSLQAIQDTLHEYQVDNLAVQIGIEQLPALEFPAIAHLHTEGGYFVLLQSIDNQLVTYLDPAKGKIQVPIAEFAQQWSGAVLMAVANEQSGEPNYSQNKQRERNNKTNNYLIISSLAILFSLILASAATWQAFGFLLSSCLGLGLSSLLLTSQLGNAPELVQQVCHLTRQTNCEAVLQSSASKLFGWLSWAEVGFLYFAGMILSIFWANLTAHSSPIFSILAVLSVLALPYTVFSVYYQALVVRVWCPLCVLVQAVLWVNFGLLFNYLNFNYLYLFDYQSFIILGFSFSLPIVLWFSHKPTLAQAQKLPMVEKKLSHFRRNSELFNAWLKAPQAPAGEFFLLDTDLILGNLAAPLSILVVSNPLCAPCG
nr:cysteine peptidase family C39 domain-containing protein [Microscillaceae bacterium]